MRIIIPNLKNLERLKSNIKKTGFSGLHILADFDKTLTYGVVNGVKTPSIISMLRDGNHLTKDYAVKAQALFDKYHLIEIDPNVPIEKKKKLMQEWWEKHYELLIKSKLNILDIEDIVKHGHVKFRKEMPEFLDFLHHYDIPLVVLSASGCGEAIHLYFEKIGKNYPNIHYIINRFNWDGNGFALSIKSPIIHSMNKDDTMLKEFTNIFESVKNRKNVILLGDNVSDLEMIKGFSYDNLLKIGFLNIDSEKNRNEYEQNFDVVLEGDSDINFINLLIKDLG